MKIIPKPRIFNNKEHHLIKPSTFTIGFSPMFQSQAEQLSKLFGNTKKLEIIDSLETDMRQYSILLLIAEEKNLQYCSPDGNIKFNTALHNEGYILDIQKDQIILLAKSNAGMFYGISTLQQIFQQYSSSDKIPGTIIKDWPYFSIRGVSDDISRGQVSTLENFKTILDRLAQFKINVYMPYLEDMFQFKAFPQIGSNRGALSAKECRELQDYAKALNIQIIPVFQTLGHFENILIQPEFIEHAEYPGASSLNAVSPKTYKFLETLLDEFLPVFDSAYINIGADESWDIGHGASREKTEKHGNAKVHADHYLKVFELVKKHNKQIMMYGDIILDYPEILQYIPDNVIIVDWHYDLQSPYSSTEIFKKSGKPFIVSPGTQSWSRIFPDLTHARTNIAGIIKDGHENNTIGVINSAWGDFGGGNMRELNTYPFAYGAELSWNPDSNDIADFEDRFFYQFLHCEDPGIASVYHLLSSCSDYYDLNHFFGHPFYPGQRDKQHFLKRANELPLLAKQAQKEIKQLRKEIGLDTSHLDILNLCARMYEWVGILYNLRIDLQKLKLHIPDREQKLALSDQMNLLIEKLTEIKTDYKTIWLTYNKKDNLHRILTLMERVEKEIKIKQQEIMQGNVQLNGNLESRFISFPSKDESIPGVVLQKRILLDELPKTAWIQIIAETHAAVWINGNLVGTAVASRTLSAIVEAERVKYWRVEDYLQKGENIITVQVKQYKKETKAAGNIWFECEEPNLIIQSNESWKAALTQQTDINEIQVIDESAWQPAEAVFNPWIISRPYFKHGLSSRIEFYRQPPV